MLNKIFRFIAHLFKKEPPFAFDPQAGTIPEAFGYPVDNYQKIVNDLVGYLELGERLTILDSYLKTELFSTYHLDINNPQHAALLGYAFCSAVFMKKDIQTQDIVQKVIDTFYANQPVVGEHLKG